MTPFGYTLMGEEHDPRHLVANARRAEEVGLDFLVASSRSVATRTASSGSDRPSSRARSGPPMRAGPPEQPV
jgi:hypothetical protein